MNTTASVRRKETAGTWYGASTLWMCRRSLAMITPMIWIQTDGLMRFFHKPLRAQ